MPSPGKPVGSSLAVSDYYRVLIFNAPFTTYESASLVLGQPDFDTRLTPPPSAGDFAVPPSALATDGAGNLFVVDLNFCRVLEFQTPFTDGMDASVVFGQAQFTTANCPGGGGRQTASVSATELVGPSGVAVDADGNLWVSDFYASRITKYAPPFSSGMAATVAIGKVNLENAFSCNGGFFERNGSTPLPTASTLCSPTGTASR